MNEATTTPPTASTHLDWLLTDLVKRVAGAREAVLVSADGLLLSGSADIDRDRAERVAAITSGFSSLAKGARKQLGAEEVRQTIVEMDSVFLFVLAAGYGAHLSLVADSNCDIGQVAYEINRLVRQVGPYLSALPRSSGLRPGAAENDLGA
ncbi:dynein regulation protein LC7 [Nocardiopsis gilva YIM 90087]|uniref:Dynein regulation protein LC7 n=1 Tax=Nocardiopsis gilva YIM 90087 TaxID=1235441 RepID=A0A223S7Q8_9ACTN|nr:roadblock/LC7 domain-containing protein [Nocardiopsis gilva]ASU84153.1 dynein regulation protein LC7 [Nocardiopsis gilva YIM 90087]